jgi:soluble lytic murein transglycosylase-like protein
MISDGMLILQSGRGTLEFPVDQVEQILAIPVTPETKKAVNASTNAVAGSEELLLRAAIQEGLEPDFVRSVAMVESGLRQESLSPKGAVGLMQLMPLTAGELGVNATIAEQNALGGATFLRQLLIKYNGDSALALAAYNAGPGAVDKYKGVPPYMETRKYVVKVLQEYAKQQRMQAEKNAQTLKAATPTEHAGTAMIRQLN